MSERQVSATLYICLPGLLAEATRPLRPQAMASPFVLPDGRLVRDACPLALARGVRVTMDVVQARRLCLALLSVQREEVDAKELSIQLRDALAERS